MKNIVLLSSDAMEISEFSNFLSDISVQTVQSVAQLQALKANAVVIGKEFFDKDIFSLIQQIKSVCTTEILTVIPENTNFSSEFYKLNADSYIFAPLRKNETAFRIKMMLSNKFSEHLPPFRNGQMTIDYENCRVYISDKLLHLTMLEYKLLCILSKNYDSVVSYDSILRELWQTPIGNEILSLRVFVNAIRRKIRQLGDSENYIQTHMSSGYSMPKNT